jgi:hypothetical protein
MLEIVELSYTLPPSSPLSLRNSFASLLLADTVNPSPDAPIQFNLPLLDGFRGEGLEPVFSGSLDAKRGAWCFERCTAGVGEEQFRV